MRDGLNSKCKACYLRERAEYEKSDDAKAARKTQRSKPKSREQRKKWRKGPVSRAIQAHERSTSRWKERMRQYYLKHAGSDKLKSRSAVGMAIQAGKIPPAKTLVCRCGKPAQHYHHHLGYTKEHRLHVMPLCAACHYAAERNSLKDLPVV